ncbi:MAG TPA: radical SAM protein [Candidatus Nanoarchaeia archaeon]|nr:radical SAM protein [Candidatus Nanoarchaeia archaeon]
MDTLSVAEKIYLEHFDSVVCFERAIFFSWGCTIGDCAFCYMSTQPKDKELQETKRSPESIFAELILSRAAGWEIGFFTGGIGILKPAELEFLLKVSAEIIGQKLWLSVGPVTGSLLKRYLPYIKGVVGSTETINPDLHKTVCPSKPLAPYERMFEEAGRLGLEKAMTFIVGLGETKNDLPLLVDFIKKHSISKIHVYGLIPQPGTAYADSPIPSAEEQAWWIAQLRVLFPKLDIQCGVWEDRLERVPLLLKAGANSISKFRATKLFGTALAKDMEQQVQSAGRTFRGTLTKLPEVDWDKEINRLSLDESMKLKIKPKLKLYLNQIQANLNSRTLISTLLAPLDAKESP